MAEEISFGEVAKPAARETVRVRISVLSGRQFVDVRLWVGPRSDTDEGEAVPTRKGLCLAPETWRGLLPLIEEAVAAAEAEGGDVGPDTMG